MASFQSLPIEIQQEIINFAIVESPGRTIYIRPTGVASGDAIFFPTKGPCCVPRGMAVPSTVAYMIKQAGYHPAVINDLHVGHPLLAFSLRRRIRFFDVFVILPRRRTVTGLILPKYGVEHTPCAYRGTGFVAQTIPNSAAQMSTLRLVSKHFKGLAMEGLKALKKELDKLISRDRDGGLVFGRECWERGKIWHYEEQLTVNLDALALDPYGAVEIDIPLATVALY